MKITYKEQEDKKGSKHITIIQLSSILIKLYFNVEYTLMIIIVLRFEKTIFTLCF